VFEIAVWICGVFLVLAAAGAIYRLAKGPSLLDRVIASDVLLAIVGASLAIEMVYNHHMNNIFLLVIVSLVGFLGSVTVARNAGTGKS
jgi:multicomponent Na+:H+ antiporter subunit F